MTYYSKEFTNEQGEFQYYTNPVKAIRAKCLYDCCCGSKVDVDNCQCTECFLYPFRSGKNPYRTKRTLTEEQKEKLRNRLSKN